MAQLSPGPRRGLRANAGDAAYWHGAPSGPSRSQALLPRTASRLTALRCFKGGNDDGAKPSTTLRLNFKVPYRVNYGQSLGLVGAGDTLGNWNPKRVVHMKWTDGDWWTVELDVAPGTSSLDLEYKYVVVNHDGNVGHWKPGSNYRVTLPLQSSGPKVPKRVKVSDAWDDSFKKVDVEEADSVPSAAASTHAPAAKPQPQPAQAQVHPAQAATVAPPAAAPPAQQAAVAQVPAAVAGSPLVFEVPPLPTSPASATAASDTARPQANGNGVAAAQASPQAAASPVSPGAQGQASQQQQAETVLQAEAAQGQGNGAAAPAAASRTGPQGSGTATAAPALQPSLLAEQDVLEDGVRGSIEDLQAQMDRHQQLRERTNDPAAPELLVADRIVAAANNRVLAYNKALKAVQDYTRLPASRGSAKEPSGGVDK